MQELDPLSPDALEPQSDHEILIVIAGEMRHQRAHTKDLADHVGEQNGRIGQLEKWQLRVIAAAGTVTGIAGLFAALLALPAFREAIGHALAGG